MESTMETLEDRMLKSLEALDQNEFQSFKSRLQLPVYLEGLQPLTKFRLETADRKDTVSLIMQAYPNNGVKITVNVLKKMNRNDLLKWFIPEDSSRIEPPEAQQSMKKNSSRIELPEARQNMKKRKRLVGGIIVGISVGVILTVISVMQGVMFHANLRHSSALTSRPADQGRTSLPNYSGNPESPHDIPHQQDLKYIQVEGTLRLRPDTKPRSITSILWANGPNKVAIWYEGYYGTFNEHTELDKETGMLVISNMIIEDSGVYSVKVNGRLLSKTYKVEVIKKVPKPLVTTDQECSPTINCCSLVCGVKRTSIHQLSGRLEEYDAMKDTGLVTYRWRLVRRDGRVEWETHNRNPERLFLTYKDSEHVSESFCEMKNQVSVMESDPFPFHFIGQSGGPCGPTGPCLRECLDKDLPYTPLAGGILELLPDNNSVLEPITGILWTMNTDSTMKNVAEWNASFGPNVNYNGTYGGRTALNKETGKLVINNMTKEDKNVTKPSVALGEPCSPKSTYCSLVCQGDSSNVFLPPTYRWKEDQGEWMESGLNPASWFIPNDDEGKKVEHVFCEMKNSISVRQSDPFNNPLYIIENVAFIPLGGILELLPDTNFVTEPITGILWKHGPNEVVEYYAMFYDYDQFYDTAEEDQFNGTMDYYDYGTAEAEGDLFNGTMEWDQFYDAAEGDQFNGTMDYYGTYRNRTELNKETGKLIINNMNIEDSGVYSVEVNGRLQNMIHKITVMKKVPKPLVDIRKPCSPQSTNCTLVCEGNITDSGLVTYRWKKDEGEWMVSDSGQSSEQLIIVNDEEGRKVEHLFCEMKNPVSVEQSDPLDNLFYLKGNTSMPWSIGGIGVALTLVSVMLGLIFRDHFKEMLCSCGSKPVVNPDGGKETEVTSSADGYEEIPLMNIADPNQTTVIQDMDTPPGPRPANATDEEPPLLLSPGEHV